MNGTAPCTQSITSFQDLAEWGLHRTLQPLREQAGLQTGTAQSQAQASVLHLSNLLGHKKFWECFNLDDLSFIKVFLTQRQFNNVLFHTGSLHSTVIFKFQKEHVNLRRQGLEDIFILATGKPHLMRQGINPSVHW